MNGSQRRRRRDSAPAHVALRRTGMTVSETRRGSTPAPPRNYLFRGNLRRVGAATLTGFTARAFFLLGADVVARQRRRCCDPSTQLVFPGATAVSSLHQSKAEPACGRLSSHECCDLAPLVSIEQQARGAPRRTLLNHGCTALRAASQFTCLGPVVFRSSGCIFGSTPASAAHISSEARVVILSILRSRCRGVREPYAPKFGPVESASAVNPARDRHEFRERFCRNGLFGMGLS